MRTVRFGWQLDISIRWDNLKETNNLEKFSEDEKILFKRIFMKQERTRELNDLALDREKQLLYLWTLYWNLDSHKMRRIC